MLWRRKNLYPLLFAMAIGLTMTAPVSAAVWIVGKGGDFKNIQDALDAVSDGDTILVKSGYYSSVKINNLGVNIVADTGAYVDVEGGITVQNLAAHRTVVIIGIKVKCDYYHYKEGLVLKDNYGAVRIEDGEFKGSAGDNDVSSSHYHPNGWYGAHIENCVDVALVRCSLEGGDGAHIWDDWLQYPCGNGGSGLYADNSVVALFDSVLVGGDGGSNVDVSSADGGSGGSGYETQTAFLFASGSAFYGGDGGCGGDKGSFTPAGNGGNGGHGIHLAGTPAEAQLLDNTYQGGQGGQGGGGIPPGYNGAPGQGISVIYGSVNHINGTACGHFLASPVREGEVVKIDFMGAPGDLAGLFMGMLPDTMFVPCWHGQWLLSFSPPPLFAIFGHVPGSGTLSISTSIPNLPPGIAAATVYLQSIFKSGAGITMLGSPRTLVILDEIY